MATGETGFDDVTFDLVSVQHHSLKAGHDHGQYVRDANAGLDDVASFFEEVMAPGSSVPFPRRALVVACGFGAGLACVCSPFV